MSRAAVADGAEDDGCTVWPGGDRPPPKKESSAYGTAASEGKAALRATRGARARFIAARTSFVGSIVWRGRKVGARGGRPAAASRMSAAPHWRSYLNRAVCVFACKCCEQLFTTNYWVRGPPPPRPGGPRAPLISVCAAAPVTLSFIGVAECSTADASFEHGSASCAAGVASCSAGETVGLRYVNYNGVNSSIALCLGVAQSTAAPPFSLVGGAYIAGPPHAQHCIKFGDGSCKSFTDRCGKKTLFSLPSTPGYVDGVWSWCFGATADAVPATGLAHCRSAAAPNEVGTPYANVTVGTLDGYCASRQYCAVGAPSTLYQDSPGNARDTTVLCCTDEQLCPPNSPW